MGIDDDEEEEEEEEEVFPHTVRRKGPKLYSVPGRFLLIQVLKSLSLGM
jgi:hypothetical protein